MRFFKICNDEIVVTDGKDVVIVMARAGDGEGGAIHIDNLVVELEGYNTYSFCKDCKENTVFAQARRRYDYHWTPCEDCPKEVKPR